MTSHEFFQQVSNHPDLTWLGVKEDFEDLGDVVIVSESTRGIKTAIAITAVRDNDWETLEAVLTLKRPAKLMTHLTRVVGYYSRVSNWNRSKLAELRDRQRGNYSISEPPKKKKVMIPGIVGRKNAGAKSGSRTRMPEGAGV